MQYFAILYSTMTMMLETKTTMPGIIRICMLAHSPTRPHAPRVMMLEQNPHLEKPTTYMCYE